MSSWKRGFLEIIAEILESLMSSPMKKTHITFRCNLDSRAVTKYLSIMQFVGLVEKSKKDSSFYVISQKGIEYRNQFQSFMSVMEKDMENYLSNHVDSKEMLADLKMRKRS
jgi:predicted transcriptional regulator